MVRLRLRDGRAERLSLGTPALEDDLRRLAVDRDGNPLTVQAETLAVQPFADADRQLPLRVLIHAEAAKDDPPGSPRAWVFLRADMSEQGLGNLERLPLWVEEHGGETVLDEAHATVRVPGGTRLAQVEAFTVAPDRFALYLMLLLPEADAPLPSPTTSPPPVSWDVVQLLAVFSRERLVRLVNLEREVFHDTELTRALSTATRWVVPLRFMGRPGRPRELAFHAWGIPKDKHGPSLPCAAILSLR